MPGRDQALPRCLAALAMLLAAPVAAQDRQPERVVSLNLCTDQLLLDLAPRERIAGLSPFAADAAQSFLAGRVQGLPILSGTAEEVMVIRPDLVVSGTFTKRATREFIRRQGIPIEEFPPARTLAETRAQIARFGEIAGAREKAAIRIGEIDLAIRELRAAASPGKLRILPLARRGWVSGADSLISELLAEAGLMNAAGELGLAAGGIVRLEQVIALRPDAILLAGEDDHPEDQGRAMLLHPALQAMFPAERRLVVPERLTVCGGPMLGEAMRSLARQVSRLKPRDAD